MDYININRALWNQRTTVHLDTEFYDVRGFINGKNSLNSIELDILGNMAGRSVLHLQCHFGQDSISLSRMGATVTGVDLSDKAIEAARRLAIQTQSDTEFICCDLYALPDHLDRTFDYVFTSYGTIGWLPDLDKWASVVSRFLKPGGRFLIVDFHPVVWMFDNDFKEIGYRYFRSDAIVETENGTYADKEADIQTLSISWNHGMAEILSSLIKYGLEITTIQEFDYSPYNCFRHTIEAEPGRFRIKHLGDKIPMVYAIGAVKK